MKLNFHENHRLLYGTVFFGFLTLTLVIAIGPALWVQDHNRPLPGSKALSPQEQRGLDIYVSEGCLYCHTQQVRPLDVDSPFGRPSAPGDYAGLKPQDIWRMTPELLGTERTGPDLSDVGARQSSAEWNYIHLYEPRAVVKGSVMQAYQWMFGVVSSPGPDDVVVPVPAAYAPSVGRVVATQEAKDLVAYLLSLKQVAMPGVAAESGRSGSKTAGGSVMGMRIYSSRCASCHGQEGEGIPGVFPPLKGDPVVTAADPSGHISIVLFGIRGKDINGTTYAAAMPAHKSMFSDAEIAAVINHERTSWGNSAPTVTSEDVEHIREKGGRQ